MKLKLYKNIRKISFKLENNNCQTTNLALFPKLLFLYLTSN